MLADASTVVGAGSECYETITRGHVPEDATGDHVDGDAALDYVAGVLPSS